MKTISPSRFRKIRRSLGKTQVGLGKWFGVSDQTIANWEKGKVAIPGPSQVLIWLLFEVCIKKNKHAIREHLHSVGVRWPR